MYSFQFLKSKQYNLKFQCKHCSYSTDKKCHFTYHERLHSVSHLYKCIYCPETSKHHLQQKHEWVQTKKNSNL
uniref:C2H2-type domain-containing protein n=1 Tax=Dolomedes mizhoanus TaxID=1366394 RepID=S5MKB8_9ARAC|nr:hypothetical protein [Dolomedes mizhoanus]